MMPMLCGNPRANMSSNLEKPPDNRFIMMPKIINDGIKPHQNLRSLVARRIPLLAKANSSHHCLQFIVDILA